MLFSWLFKHFLASRNALEHGVRQGFVPKLVPNYSGTKILRCDFGALHNNRIRFDVHKRTIGYCVKNGSAKLVGESTIPSTQIDG
jgi:hypothetical protein